MTGWPSSPSSLGLLTRFCSRRPHSSQPVDLCPALCFLAASFRPGPGRRRGGGSHAPVLSGARRGACPVHWAPATPPRPGISHPVTIQGRVGLKQPVLKGTRVPLCLEVLLIQDSERREPSPAHRQHTFTSGLPRFKHMQIRVNAEPAAFFR